MRGINQVFLMGHLGHEPELRTLPSGKKVCDIRIATHRSTRTDAGWDSHTDWHRIRLWDRHAELAAQYLHTGHPVAAQGMLRTDTWTDSDGNPQQRTVVYCQKLHLVRAPGSAENAANDTMASHDGSLHSDLANMPASLAAPGVPVNADAPF